MRGIYILLVIGILFSPKAFANESPVSDLNTIPTARFIKPDTLSFKLEALDPYVKLSVGHQFGESFFARIHQTYEGSSYRETFDFLTPGIDLKFKLSDEGRFIPQISLGFNNAIGHVRHASEYISFSKRYYDFDITGGVAWGRLGSAGNISNPLGLISDHFESERNFTSNDINRVSDWFTGEDIGFYGGLAYYTPLKNLVLTADWNADRYLAEEVLIAGFDAPSPWSVGAQYTPFPWLELSGGLIGGDKLMGRARIFENPLSLGQNEKANPKPSFERDKKTQRIKPHFFGLQGPTIIVPEHLYTLVQNDKASLTELWHNKEVSLQRTPKNYKLSFPHIGLKLEEVFSLAEEEDGIFHRSSAIAEAKQNLPFGFLAGAGLRLNLSDNLHTLTLTRAPQNMPIRSDIYNYTNNPVNLDTAYLANLQSITPELHISLMGGYLEEMFAGAGGEVLYRPFGQTLSLGAELWRTYKRDGLSDFATQLNGTGITTGHINAFYEIPDTNMTAKISGGRYLAGDWGGSLALENHFSNGATIEAHVTATNQRDMDVFGNDADYYAGLNIKFPFSLPYTDIADSFCCDADIQVRPVARDKGQRIQKPIALYDATESFSYRYLANNWNEVVTSP